MIMSIYGRTERRPKEYMKKAATEWLKSARQGARQKENRKKADHEDRDLTKNQDNMIKRAEAEDAEVPVALVAQMRTEHDPGDMAEAFREPVMNRRFTEAPGFSI